MSALGVLVQLEDSIALAKIAEREGVTLVQLMRMLARVADLPPEQSIRIAMHVVRERGRKEAKG